MSLREAFQLEPQIAPSLTDILSAAVQTLHVRLATYAQKYAKGKNIFVFDNIQTDLEEKLYARVGELVIDLPPASTADIRGIAAYKAIHEICARPEVDVCVSLRTGKNFDDLNEELSPISDKNYIYIDILSPYKKSPQTAKLRVSKKKVLQP